MRKKAKELGFVFHDHSGSCSSGEEGGGKFGIVTCEKRKSYRDSKARFSDCD